MSGKPNIDEVLSELGLYVAANKGEMMPWVYNKPTLFEYCKTVPKIQGEWKVPFSITSHLVQGFSTTWNELGDTTIKGRVLNARRQKINFPLVPDDIYNSWIGDMLVQGKDLKEQPIAQYIMQNELLPKIAEDVAYLIVNGQYDEDQLDSFGYSLEGLRYIFNEGVNAANATHSMYRIDLDAITDSNARDQIMAFEKAIPSKFRNRIKTIFCGTDTLDSYITDVQGTFVNNPGQFGPLSASSPLRGYKMVGIPELEGTGIIFATPEGNMVKLVDVLDAPAITDIQKDEYKLKIFADFTLGIDFAIYEMVFVSTPQVSGSGLKNGTTSTYFS